MFDVLLVMAVILTKLVQGIEETWYTGRGGDLTLDTPAAHRCGCWEALQFSRQNMESGEQGNQ